MLKCTKRGTLVGPAFFSTFFRQEHEKNSAASKKFWEIVFGKSTKSAFTVLKDLHFLSKIENV